MTNDEVERFFAMDETKALVLSIVFVCIWLTVILAIVFFPLAGYQFWKYLKIKDALEITRKYREG